VVDFKVPKYRFLDRIVFSNPGTPWCDCCDAKAAATLQLNDAGLKFLESQRGSDSLWGISMHKLYKRTGRCTFFKAK
jgi:hypothetical protein